MKFTKLSVSIAAVIVSSAVSAHGPSVTPELTVKMSGASAQDKAIGGLVNTLCVAGTLDTFKDATKGGKNYTNYFCTIDSSQVSGMPVDRKVLFKKRSAGGSGIGVAPVLDATPIEFMSITNGNCIETSSGSQKWDCTITGAGDLVLEAPDAGVSDVNPEMFVGPNVPAGFAPVNATRVNNEMDVVGAAALLFGVPVTDGLYNALQIAQDLTTVTTGSCTVGDYTEACMPSLSSNQIASIYAGQVEDWNDITVNGTPLPSVAGVVAPTNSQVHICRRVNGSGTQAQSNAVYLRNPCTAGASNPVSQSGFFGPTVVLGSGSSNVNACLDDFGNGTNNGGDNPNLETNWAVGVQSMEKNADASLAYKFIKVDGVAPTLENAWKGHYKQWVEQTFQWLKTFSGEERALVETIAANASSPTELSTNAKLNPAFVHPFGPSGYLALTTNGFAPDTVFNTANPVIPYTHIVGGKLNNCQIPVINLDSNFGTVDTQL